MQAQGVRFTYNQIPDRIMNAWIEFIEQEERFAPSNRRNCYASGYEKCIRKLVFQMTQGDKIIPFPPETRAKFRRGRDRERTIISDLMKVGRYGSPKFSVVEQQQRFELKDKKDRVAISGKVDFRLEFSRRVRIPCELKDWVPTITDRIHTFDDVLTIPWTRKGALQLLCYLFGFGEPFGILILARPGLPKFIPVHFEDHLDLIEDFMQRAEQANDHRDAGTLPDYIEDTDECKRCDFYAITCDPPLLSGKGSIIINDPDVEEIIRRHEEILPFKREFDRLDRKIKDRFRDMEQDNAIVGKFLLQKRYGTYTRIELPKRLRKKYLKIDEKGKVFIDISEVGAKSKKGDESENE